MPTNSPKLPVSPWAGPSTDVAKFLDELKTGALAPKAGETAGSPFRRGRLIFGLDATASRAPTWDSACRVQGEMFEATAALGGLDLQLAFFRGFDQCRVSRWVSRAADLHRLMSSVSTLGGHTQIARILEHARGETAKRQLDALVYVGDAMEEELDKLCHLAGKLGAAKVPVFVFHQGSDPIAETAFKQIALLSNGVYLAFDLSNIARLKDLLGAVAVFATGDCAALEDYGKKKGGEILRLTARLRRPEA